MGNSSYPNGTGISIDTMDGHLDLADVVWQQIAPCGCINGLSVAATRGELTVTADQAMHCFADTELEYQRDVAQGFTCRPREHHAGCDEAKLGCEHTPKWGVEPDPKPEGYVWAAVYALGSHPRYTHLVPVAAVEKAKARDYSAPLHTKPLCGQGKGDFHWNDEWHATGGKVPCKKCIAKGRALAEGVVA